MDINDRIMAIVETVTTIFFAGIFIISFGFMVAGWVMDDEPAASPPPAGWWDNF